MLRSVQLNEGRVWVSTTWDSLILIWSELDLPIRMDISMWNDIEECKIVIILVLYLSIFLIWFIGASIQHIYSMFWFLRIGLWEIGFMCIDFGWKVTQYWWNLINSIGVQRTLICQSCHLINSQCLLLFFQVWYCPK